MSCQGFHRRAGGWPLVVLLCMSCCPEATQGTEAGAASAEAGTAGTATLSVIQQQLFDKHCVSSCHEATNAAADLRLTPGKSFSELVNVASQQVSSQLRVVPGSPEKSYLVKKLEGGVGIVGDQMPRLAPPRPQAEIDLVRGWISRGAPND